MTHSVVARVFGWICLVPVAVRLHEAAHAAVASTFGWRVRIVNPETFTLDNWASRIEYDADAATWPQHATVALAGPAASLAWAAIVAALCFAGPWPAMFALLPAMLFAFCALAGCGADLADARRAIGCALADALDEEVDASTLGVALAALRLARRRRRP